MEFFATEMARIGGIILFISFLLPSIVAIFFTFFEDECESEYTSYAWGALFANIITFIVYFGVCETMIILNVSASVIDWSFLIWSIIFALIQTGGFITGIVNFISSRKQQDGLEDSPSLD